MSTGPRYATIDLLRGVAALIVLRYHLSPEGTPNLLRPDRGYLAVDLFFILSGFVIAKVYRPRLADGQPVLAYLGFRIIRLYPLFFLGIIITCFTLVVSIALRGSIPESYMPLARSIPSSLFMLPSFNTGSLFTFNTAAWSLFFELMINVVYGFTWRAWTIPGCLVLMGFGSVCLTYIGSSLPFWGGAEWRNWYVGLFRCLVDFPSGVIIAHLSIRLFLVPRWLVAAICVSALLFAVYVTILPDLLVIFLFFGPVIILASSEGMTRSGRRKLSAILGDVSYAVYALHLPLVWLITLIFNRLNLPAIDDANSSIASFMILTVAVAIAADYSYDRPVREYLSRRWKSLFPIKS